MKRRTVLLGAATLGAAAPLAYLFGRNRRDQPSESDAQLVEKSGPLLLHPGFSCAVLMRAGATLSDGSRSGDAPDGMACFALPDGNWALLRNHELTRDVEEGCYPAGSPELAYDRKTHGGVSRLVLRPADLKVLSSNTVLTGTLRNCAGGPSPWGWLTCEETDEPNHGYVFVCPETADRLLPPHRVPGYGRFRHEAVAVDPESLAAYLTEDESDGCLYRFVPHDKSAPFEGSLSALRVRGQPDFDVSKQLRPGRKVQVEWVPIEDPEAQRTTTRKQAHALGAARIRRGEGCWMDGKSVVFSSTSGGLRGLGQILRLRIGGLSSRGGREPDTLETVAEAAHPDDFKGPDNITVAPWGDLIVAEDGGSDQHLRGITPNGRVYPLARNVLSDGELAGVCFSPDGSTLFCNLQRDGWTVAIRGPWEKLRGVV